MNKIFGLNRQRIRRKSCRIRPQIEVGSIAHRYLQRASVCYVSVAKPNLAERLPVETDALDVFVIPRRATGNNDKILAVFKVDGRLIEYRTAHIVGWDSRSYGIETQHRED